MLQVNVELSLSYLKGCNLSIDLVPQVQLTWCRCEHCLPARHADRRREADAHHYGARRSICRTLLLDGNEPSGHDGLHAEGCHYGRCSRAFGTAFMIAHVLYISVSSEMNEEVMKKHRTAGSPFPKRLNASAPLWLRRPCWVLHSKSQLQRCIQFSIFWGHPIEGTCRATSLK